jgi:phasin family protein
MSTLPEQFSAARKSQVEAQINFFQNYASTAVQNAEKLFALNLSTTRASMAQSSAAVRQLLAAQDPRDLLALTTQTQAGFDSFLAYSRALFSIAGGAQAALLKQDLAPQAVPAALPKTQPAVLAIEAEQAPKSAPAAPAATKAKPIAKAVSKVAAPVAPAKPVAAPVALDAGPVAVTGLKAVEASAPKAEPKQLDMLAPKAKKKK